MHVGLPTFRCFILNISVPRHHNNSFPGNTYLILQLYTHIFVYDELFHSALFLIVAEVDVKILKYSVIGQSTVSSHNFVLYFVEH
jgi:hypothetical protein